MVLVKKKSNFYRAVIKLLGILFCSSSVHANTPRLFPVCRCPCWRRPSRKAFALRRFTPTRPGFFRFAGAHVGVDLPAKPLPFVGSRQHAPAFPDLPAPMLASPSSQSRCPSLSHANTQKYRFFTFSSGILIKEQTCTGQQQLDYEPRRACN